DLEAENEYHPSVVAESIHFSTHLVRLRQRLDDNWILRRGRIGLEGSRADDRCVSEHLVSRVKRLVANMEADSTTARGIQAEIWIRMVSDNQFSVVASIAAR